MKRLTLCNILIWRYSISLCKYEEPLYGFRKLKFGKYDWYKFRIAIDIGKLSLLIEYY